MDLQPGPWWGPTPGPLSNLGTDVLACPGLAALPQKGWHGSRGVLGVGYLQWMQLVFLGVKA